MLCISNTIHNMTLTGTFGTTKPAETSRSNGAIGPSSVSGGTGPYNSVWTTSSSTPVPNATSFTVAQTGLAAGTYNITITSADSQTLTHAFVVASVPILTLTAGTVTDSSHYGQGSIAASTVTGGTQPYVSVWSGNSHPHLSTLAGGLADPGVYTLTVTDANSRSVTHVFTVHSPKIRHVRPFGHKKRTRNV
jgi:hypothetical protein